MDEKREPKSWTTDVHTIEFVHGLMSAWCAWALATDGNNFERNAQSFFILTYFENREGFWAWFIGMAGALELLGLVAFWVTGSGTAGWISRVIGLSMASLFFFMVGLGWTIGNPDSLAGPFIFVFAIRGWHVLYLKWIRA